MLEQTLSAHFSASDWLLPPHPESAATASRSTAQSNADSRLMAESVGARPNGGQRGAADFDRSLLCLNRPRSRQ
jgi:hypothetical protein